MQKGTKNLFTFLTTCIAIGVSVENALADDGKISGFSELYLIGKTAVVRIPEFAQVAPEALAEAKDLTVIEVVDLVQQIKKDANYKNFTNDKISRFIEAGLDTLQALSKFGRSNGESFLAASNVRQALRSMQIQEKKDLKDANQS